MAAEALVKTRDFTAEVVEEVKKVTWPDFAQLKNATFVIIIFVIIVAIIIWLMDVVTRNVLNLILNLFTR